MWAYIYKTAILKKKRLKKKLNQNASKQRLEPPATGTPWEQLSETNTSSHLTLNGKTYPKGIVHTVSDFTNHYWLFEIVTSTSFDENMKCIVRLTAYSWLIFRLKCTADGADKKTNLTCRQKDKPEKGRTWIPRWPGASGRGPSCSYPARHIVQHVSFPPRMQCWY